MLERDHRFNVNDVLAFFLEVAALAILSVWGLRTGQSTPMRALLGIGAPTAAIMLFILLLRLYVAPRSRYTVGAVEIGVKILVLGGAAIASFTLVPVGWAVAFTVLVAVNLVLLYVGPFAR